MTYKALFGGQRYVFSRQDARGHLTSYRGWEDTDWTASDDRVRGGKSQVSPIS